MRNLLLIAFIVILYQLFIQNVEADACSASCGASTRGATCSQGEACCESRCRNSCGRPGGYCTLFGSCQCN